jgi:hypothetical protein
MYGAPTVAGGYCLRRRDGLVRMTVRRRRRKSGTIPIMNTIVRAMGFTDKNAFDPRDNGFVCYGVVRKPQNRGQYGPRADALSAYHLMISVRGRWRRRR